MKKIFTLLFVSALFFTSCEGPEGPPGPSGFDGGLIVANAFEIEVNFTPSNNYLITEPYGFEVLPSDVVLVYIESINDGQSFWRPLPQTILLQEGTLIYNFDFTQQDVGIFLDGDIDFNILGPEYTQRKFRVVVIPADNVDAMDISNLDNVIKATNIKSFIKK